VTHVFDCVDGTDRKRFSDSSKFSAPLMALDSRYAETKRSCTEKYSTLRWLNTVFDTCVSFTFFSKTLDLSVAKNGSNQVNNTNFGFLMVKLTYVPLPWQHE